LQFVDALQRGDKLLGHRHAFAPVFEDMQLGASGGGFLAETHSCMPAREENQLG
jgi:hypothetical protein